ncbi:hypothetical protein K32_42340 [Kaistia sp. 32K]|nr:hypothetical protein K32_42340 [Kaistia sp. 32K]
MRCNRPLCHLSAVALSSAIGLIHGSRGDDKGLRILSHVLWMKFASPVAIRPPGLSIGARRERECVPLMPPRLSHGCPAQEAAGPAPADNTALRAKRLAFPREGRNAVARLTPSHARQHGNHLCQRSGGILERREQPQRRLDPARPGSPPAREKPAQDETRDGRASRQPGGSPRS